MVVDDEQVARELLFRVLSKEEYEIVTAGTGKEVLEKFNKDHFNLAIVDIRLPDVDGVELLIKLKQMDPAMEGIIITGFATMDSAIKSLKEAASEYITKPFGDIGSLARTVNRLVEKQKLTVENKRLQEETEQQRDELKKRVSELEMFYEISNAVSYTFDGRELLKIIISSLKKVIDYDICSIFISDGERGNLTMGIPVGVNENFRQEAKNDVINAFAKLSNKSLDNSTINEEVIATIDAVKKDTLQMKSSFNLPLVVENRILGILGVYSGRENTFSPADERILSTIANQTAMAVKGLQSIITDEKSRIKAMVDSMVEGVIMFDKREEIVILNPQAKRLLGFSRQAEIDRCLLNDKLKAFNLGESFGKNVCVPDSIIKEIIVSGEENKVLHCETSAVKNTEGEIIGRVIILRDITEEKAVDKLKTEFVSTVSHELRTPLTTIRETVSQILDGILGETTQRQREFLSMAIEDVDRLARIINNLLDMSKIEAKKFEIKREIFNIVDLVKAESSSFALPAAGKGLEIKTSFLNDKIEVYADRDKIIQVFTNLVGNAIKFTERGYIEISVTDKPEHVECAVADTGKGMAEEDLPKVFDKFQQFDRTHGPGQKGTGLGLSITKGIIELHKGNIWAESKLTQGSKFTFILPKYDQEEIFSDSITREIAEAKRKQQEFSLFIIKLDNYAEIKKEVGEEGQQKVFTSVLRTIENFVRNKDLAVFRNKDEVIMLVEVNKENVRKVLTRLKQALKESIFEIAEEAKINFSYGYSIYPLDGDNMDDLRQKAQQSLITEKEQTFKKNIMIVDDERDLVDFVRHFLEEFGYQNITVAYDGEEALQKISIQIPDLMLLDMKMKKMNGYEVIGRLKENVETKDIPILIMSAFEVDAEELRQYLKKKAMPVMSKPLKKEQLKKFVAYML